MDAPLSLRTLPVPNAVAMAHLISANTNSVPIAPQPADPAVRSSGGNPPRKTKSVQTPSSLIRDRL
jgi:hypothetical protein